MHDQAQAGPGVIAKTHKEAAKMSMVPMPVKCFCIQAYLWSHRVCCMLGWPGKKRVGPRLHVVLNSMFTPTCSGQLNHCSLFMGQSCRNSENENLCSGQKFRH